MQVDDDFFSLKNMEKFLDQQDALLEKDPVMFDRQLDEMYESDDSSVSKSAFNPIAC